jgi:hypothetical protein
VGQVVPASVGGDDAKKLRYAAKNVGDSTVIVVVNMDSSPISDWRLQVDGKPFSSVESFFYTEEKIALREGAISEELLDMGLASTARNDG